MPRYNPNKHHRQSIRLQGYDYSQPGLYFITSCCQDGKCRFGSIKNGEMILNDFGLIATQEWEKLPERYPTMELDVYQIMPNHMHGIIHITNAPDELLSFQNANSRTGINNVDAIPAPTCNDIIGSYKSLVANTCLEIYKLRNQTMGKFWQRNFYEHIIRNKKSYEVNANYIINNPQSWKTDKFHNAEE